MKIDTLERENHQLQVNVECEQEQIESARRRAARKISQRIKIPGFRPGKAPFDVVLRTAGETTVNEEAIELLIDEIYPKMLDEAGIKPAAPGTLEEFGSIESPKFKFLVPLAPTAELGDYRSIRVEYDWKVPDDSKVDETIEELRKMYSSTEAVERPIIVGDFVLTDVIGIDKKSNIEEKPLVESMGFPVFIRPEEKSDEWPFVGFSNELLGLKPGDSKEITHKYPKEYKDEQFQGKSIRFSITIKSIRGMILPDLNDEFAKKVGGFENIQLLREAIKSNLTNQSRIEYDESYFEEIIEKIKLIAIIKYPPQILDHEKEHVLGDIKQRLANQKMEFDAYLKMRNLDNEKFTEDEVIPVAKKRLERSLILDQLAIAEKIEISEEHINKSFQQTWAELQGSEQFQKLVKKNKPSQKIMESVAMESANRAMLQETLNRLKQIAMGQFTDVESLQSDPIAKDPKKKPRKPKSTVPVDNPENINNPIE